MLCTEFKLGQNEPSVYGMFIFHPDTRSPKDHVWKKPRLALSRSLRPPPAENIGGDMYRQWTRNICDTICRISGFHQRMSGEHRSSG